MPSIHPTPLALKGKQVDRSTFGCHPQSSNLQKPIRQQSPHHGGPTNPLSLPYILQRIGYNFLDPSDLLVAILVCKDWCQYLMPCLWQVVPLILYPPSSYKFWSRPSSRGSDGQGVFSTKAFDEAVRKEESPDGCRGVGPNDPYGSGPGLLDIKALQRYGGLIEHLKIAGGSPQPMRILRGLDPKVCCGLDKLTVDFQPYSIRRYALITGELDDMAVFLGDHESESESEDDEEDDLFSVESQDDHHHPPTHHMRRVHREPLSDEERQLLYRQRVQEMKDTSLSMTHFCTQLVSRNRLLRELDIMDNDYREEGEHSLVLELARPFIDPSTLPESLQSSPFTSAAESLLSALPPSVPSTESPSSSSWPSSVPATLLSKASSLPPTPSWPWIAPQSLVNPCLRKLEITSGTLSAVVLRGLLLRFPGLEVLHLSLQYFDSPETWVDQLLNQGKVSVDEFSAPVMSPLLWYNLPKVHPKSGNVDNTATSNLPYWERPKMWLQYRLLENLRVLSLRGMPWTDLDTFIHFASHCSGLEELTFWFEDNFGVPSSEEIWDQAGHAPQDSSDDDEQIWNPATQSTSYPLLPHLHTLNLHRVDNLSDKTLADLLAPSTTQHLRRVHISRASFATAKTVKNLVMYHCQTLKSLCLQETPLIQSKDLQRLLCASTSRLERFETDGFLNVQDMAQSKQGWGCDHVRVFRAAFHGNFQEDSSISTPLRASEAELHRVLYTQLAASLSHVKTLVLSGSDYDPLLDLSLEHGLDELRVLGKSLESFEYSKSSHNIGKKEKAWMKANWPRLREIRGHLNLD